MAYRMLLHLLCVNVLFILANARDACELSRTTRYTAISKQNESGHWVAQVVLRHGGAYGNADTPLEVDVEHTVSRCKGQPLVEMTATVTGPFRTPPGPGYEFVPNMGFYKLHTTWKPWLEAAEVCREEGAHLAIINSKEESAHLAKMVSIAPANLEWFHVGFHDRDVEGKFITIDDQPLKSAGFDTWAPGQPNNNSKNCEDCGCIGRNGLLYDVTCDTSLPFLCEQEI